jgi:hypothetical protein
MWKWRTHEEKLAYHREHNAKYRKEHSDKIKAGVQARKEREMLEEFRVKINGKGAHRVTVLHEQYDEGDVL